MLALRRLERHATWLVTLLLLLAAGFIRFYRVTDSVHPDSLLWFRRTQVFWRMLGEGNFGDTYRAPHPGVMLMWLSGLVMKLNGTLEASIDPRGLFALKVPGALLGSLAAGLTYPLARACLGKAQWAVAFVLAALLATEPLLLEQSRMAHLDMAALGFAWLGVWLSMLAYERSSPVSAWGAGALFGMACLTKLSLAPIPAALMSILLVASALTRFRDRRGLIVAVLATLGAVLTMFALWPALWVSPSATLQRMLREASEVSAHGHGAGDPGVMFYVNYALSSTPIDTLVLALVGLVGLAGCRSLPGPRKHLIWACLSLVPGLVIIAVMPKKLTRYVLPLAPLLCVLASVGLVWLARRAQAWRKLAPQLIVAVVALLLVARYARSVWILPSAQCTSWLCRGGERPSDMYFMRSLARGIAKDWEPRGKRRPARVFVHTPQLLSPWLKAKEAKRPRKADYVVVWDASYADLEAGELTARAARRYGRLGRDVVTVRHEGRVVARVYRTGK